MTERLSAVAATVSSLEYLAGASAVHRGGLNDASVRIPDGSSSQRRLLACVASPCGSKTLHCLRAFAGVALLAPTGRRVRFAADGALATSAALLFLSEPHGTDGSDQVALLAHSAATFARLGEADHRVVDAAMWFLAMQSGLSYLASGLAKVAGESWMTGVALPGIFRTQTYGHEPTWRFLRRHTVLARRASRAVVAVECAMPFAALARGRLARTYVSVSELFHLANGLSMGLGRFLWAYSALHPSVLYVSASQGDLPEAERRSDLLPAVVASMVVGTWAASAIAALRARSTIRRGTTTEQTIVARSGNQLAFEQLGDWSSDGPVVVIESGLGASGLSVVRIARGLADRLPVLTYARAGYGSSQWSTLLPPSLDVCRQDARDLVGAVVSGERQIVFVGHSLGGHLVLTAHAEMAARCVAAAVLDPTHVDRGEHRGETSQRLLRTAVWIVRSLSAGLGQLLMPSKSISELPADIVVLATAQYRDSGTWTAARRELQAVLRDTQPHLTIDSVPLLVMTGERTGIADRTQLDLDRRLAAAHEANVHRVIAHADHEGLVSRPECARDVVQHIFDHVEAAMT